MERELSLEAKYQKLATEYSKVRSQATVLKKAVLDEQSKSTELHEVLKKHEQTVRKRDQEIESLTFRNEQLTKRIIVLQQDLQLSSTKKGKNSKPVEVISNTDMGILNEELQKKILENAQFLNSIADKDSEIFELKEKIGSLEEVLSSCQKESSTKEKCKNDEVDKYKMQIQELEKNIKDLSLSSIQRKKSGDESEENVKLWKSEAERWKMECELLKSKPDSNDQLNSYYESQLSEILETNVLLKSETQTVWAENLSLKSRFENLTVEHIQLQNNLKKSYEELKTTNNNYRGQLDAMTEHLAAQNEKITKQCDEIQILKHRLSAKK
ncbi:unnamed protein product [Phaedon cochleariae]|uniref:Protein phosphatase 1 regulatory subunit 21 N-terminal domain-containing protein n=1 Tax=Phaedon cochleariae TaxID=80249 RepID=A0A9P0GNN0_PHACE|nr:unnamed protein product [Phaedon cochleariae]